MSAAIDCGASKFLLLNIFILEIKKHLYPGIGFYIIVGGEVAEWSNAAVLKTVEGQPSQGSNPCLSAKSRYLSALLGRDKPVLVLSIISFIHGIVV